MVRTKKKKRAEKKNLGHFFFFFFFCFYSCFFFPINVKTGNPVSLNYVKKYKYIFFFCLSEDLCMGLIYNGYSEFFIFVISEAENSE